MAMDVATFTRQLREDGVSAARQEAEGILAEAKQRAQAIEQEGRQAAAQALKEGEARIQKERQRTEAELKLVARDLLLGVKKRIEAVAVTLLREHIGATLGSAEVVKAAVVELLKQQKSGQDWELALGPTVGRNLAEAVVKDLFKTAEARGKLAQALTQEGFALRDKNEVIEVTEESVAEACRRLMSTELRKLLDGIFAKTK